MSSTQTLQNELMYENLISADLSDSDKLQHLFKSMSYDKRWTYLISNNIDFKYKRCTAIHLNKPENDIVGLWLEKLLIAGQAGVIIVENLELDKISQSRIQKLCDENHTIIVNIKVKNAHYGNLVFGPW